MKGNVYYTVPKVDEEKSISTKMAIRYGYKSENGNNVTPTWIGLQEMLSNQFGKPVYRTFGGVKYLVLEFDASFLKGEVEELMNNGANLEEPNYTLWEASELNAFNWDVENNE